MAVGPGFIFSAGGGGQPFAFQAQSPGFPFAFSVGAPGQPFAFQTGAPGQPFAFSVGSPGQPFAFQTDNSNALSAIYGPGLQNGLFMNYFQDVFQANRQLSFGWAGFGGFGF